jgi:hypothetical protein
MREFQEYVARGGECFVSMLVLGCLNNVLTEVGVVFLLLLQTQV